MTYSELVTRAAELTNLPKSKVDEVLKVFVAQTKSQVGVGREVSLPGFGKFRKKHYSARRFKKIGTEDFVTVPPKEVIHFKPSESATLRRG